MKDILKGILMFFIGIVGLALYAAFYAMITLMMVGLGLTIIGLIF